MRRYKGRMQILYVLPDYYEQYPKPCYGGWGKLYYLVVTPDGKALPCHGATQITTLAFDNVRDRSLRVDLAGVAGVPGVPRRRAGCGSPAGAVRARRSTSAAAAARRSRSPATRRTPIRSARSRPTAASSTPPIAEPSRARRSTATA